MLQIGWKVGPEQYPPTELCDYAVSAEQVGFDAIDVSDHFHPWSEAGQAAFLEQSGQHIALRLRSR